MGLFHQARRKAKELLQRAKQAVEIAIEEGEGQAMKSLTTDGTGA